MGVAKVARAREMVRQRNQETGTAQHAVTFNLQTKLTAACVALHALCLRARAKAAALGAAGAMIGQEEVTGARWWVCCRRLVAAMERARVERVIVEVHGGDLTEVFISLFECQFVSYVSH